MELIYIGNDFYHESRTMMSSLYDINGQRQDWGFVSIALQKGETVHIRPATKKELSFYTKKLKELIKFK